MNDGPTLVIDVSNMAHRAFHTTGGLSFDGDATGILYGIFRDVIEFTDLFHPARIAFCFDGGYDGRLKLYPKYKSNRRAKRKEMDDDEREVRGDLRKQIYRLRTTLLNEAGFRNVFWQDGFEADDIIASICGSHTGDFVIISTDQDLFQCLVGDRVVMWNPITKKATTQESFEDVYGVSPTMWANVKAIAGCSGDGVPGVVGVGEKTAAKYLRGELKATTKAFSSIVANVVIVERNLQLVTLPFPGCGPFDLADDDVTSKTWDKVMESIGMRSLVGRR